MWNISLPQTDTPALRLCQKWLDAYGPAKEELGNGSLICRLAADASLGDEGYRLRIDPQSAACQILIEAQTEAGLLYGLSDFLFETLVEQRQAHTWMKPYYFRSPFAEGFAPVETTSRPKIRRRGLWTWGHVIYDYKGYLEHMAQLKLNELVIWNDFAPLNAEELVAYAHALGIRVVWGYSWGWDNNVLADLNDPTVFDETLERLVRQYRQTYAQLAGDGIYFQTATETALEEVGGVPIAVSAVRLVNEAAKRLLALNPKLELQFGLHATSVQTHMDVIATVDPRVRIVWEDGGAFPYAYLPESMENRDETLAFSRALMALRPQGRSGVVTKGMICLDWTDFHHRTEAERIGRCSREVIDERMREVLPVMKLIQSGWLQNGADLYRHARVFAADRDVQVLALLEDGLFSQRIWFPAALFADCLWDPERSFESRRAVVALRPDVVFANTAVKED